MPLCPIAWCWSLQEAGRQTNRTNLRSEAEPHRKRQRGGGALRAGSRAAQRRSASRSQWNPKAEELGSEAGPGLLPSLTPPPFLSPQLSLTPRVCSASLLRPPPIPFPARLPPSPLPPQFAKTGAAVCRPCHFGFEPGSPARPPPPPPALSLQQRSLAGGFRLASLGGRAKWEHTHSRGDREFALAPN